MGAQALKRVVDAVQLVFRKPLLKVLLQERIHAFQLCSSALRHGYHFAALIARYMILQGVTAFAQSFADADLRLAFADCKARRSGAAAFVRFLRADTKSCTARVKLRCHDD